MYLHVYMLMRDASLKQRVPCIMRISIFGAFSAGKKCALYTGKYGILDRVLGCKGSTDKYGVSIFSIVSCQLLHVKLSVGNQVKRLPKSVRWFIICLKIHRLVQVFFYFIVIIFFFFA